MGEKPDDFGPYDAMFPLRLRRRGAGDYMPKTECGKKLLGLRNKAISKGMRLLDADEITGACYEAELAAMRQLVKEIVGEIKAYGYSMPKVFGNPEVRKILAEGEK